MPSAIAGRASRRRSPRASSGSSRWEVRRPIRSPSKTTGAPITYLLERELQKRGYRTVRVINAGVPGYMSWESLVNLQFRVLDLDPDLILIYHGVNDVFSRMVWPPDHYRGDNSGALGPADRAGSAAPWFERSSALRIFRIRLGLSSSQGALERNYSVPPKSGHGWSYWNQVRSGRYPAGVFRRVPAEKMLRRNPPLYYRRNLEGIVALARASGVEPVLVSFAYSDLMADDLVVSEPFRLGISQHNAVTAAISRRLRRNQPRPGRKEAPQEALMQ